MLKEAKKYIEYVSYAIFVATFINLAEPIAKVETKRILDAIAYYKPRIEMAVNGDSLVLEESARQQKMLLILNESYLKASKQHRSGTSLQNRLNLNLG